MSFNRGLDARDFIARIEEILDIMQEKLDSGETRTNGGQEDVDPVWAEKIEAILLQAEDTVKKKNR